MQSLVRSRLEAARKELLDLGLRNPLINYRYPASRGVEVVGENAVQVFQILVTDQRALSFLPASDRPSETNAEVNTTDSRLQTAESATKLQQRLLNTYYTARTTLEEQGVNTLYLALGMLHWYESDSSPEPRKAPLLLVPVSLERSSAREQFRIRYSGEELGINLSLEAKMKAEFGVDLPDPGAEEDLDIAAYFNAVSQSVEAYTRWEVVAHSLVLGFFSFGKFLLYNDLDHGSWPEQNLPADHPLLQGLLGEGFSEPAPSVGEDAFLDDEPAAAVLLQAVDADATQLLAMLAVHEGRNLVIQGPPGTGKSQTITNIIANAVGQGKKVLFVAEKNAALEVVKRRLDALELGEACLELHSHKANKKELHAELRKTLELGKPALQHLQQQVALLDTDRAELNAYSKAVNTEIQNSGWTAHALAGKLLRLQYDTDAASFPRMKFPDISTWDATRMQRAEALAEKIRAGLQEGVPPVNYLFWGSGLQVLLPSQVPVLRQELARAAEAARQLTTGADRFAALLNLPLPASREATMQLAAALELAGQRPNVQGLDTASDAWLLHGDAIDAAIQAGKRLNTIKEEHHSRLLPHAWTADVMGVRTAVLAHGTKWYRFLIGEHKTAVKQLNGLVQQPLPKNAQERLVLLDAILEVQNLEKELQSRAGLLQPLLGSHWQGSGTNWATVEEAARYLRRLHGAVAKGTVPAGLVVFTARMEPTAQLRQGHQELLQLLNEHGLALQSVGETLAFNDAVRFPGASLLHQPFSVQLPLLDAWSSQPEAIQAVISFNNLVDLAAREELLPLVQVASYWPGAPKYLKEALQKTWYEHLFEAALNSFAVLRRFERTAHETVVARFRDLDLRSLQYNRAKAALAHWEGLPPADAGGQMNVLRNEFNKKARHLPIRRLMAEAGLAIQAIKPVFMMSPLSIANFIPPGVLSFDLVIFDEASQVRPVEALGALLRGRQLVVVGDSKQMPPSSFFDNLTMDEPGDDSITGNLPSILSLCDAQGVPQRMLRWHYRSRHESLIRLSNHEFYDNRLVVFPAPGSRQGAGLFFHHLPDTHYDRGQTRTNLLEAQKVALTVLEQVRRHPKQSLGVVAFSTAQRDAILDQVELLRRQHPELDQFFQQHPQEPFFIKNLENVQGDERDVIFISVGYGRTREGYVSQSFGPLNNEGGEKRLNVLITRARLRCEVFTNLTADDIDTSRSASQGVRVFKSFLQFAQKGFLEVSQASGKPAGSPFEDAVADRLTRKGYQVHRQVGATGFFIDLAVVDPEQPGRYVLGIECDGATYHSARSARDRDRLRQQVLEAMGWTIHRIWSTDWFRNPEQEMERLETAINQAWKSVLHAGDEEDEPIADTSILREEPRSAAAKLAPYQLVQLPEEIAAAEMHQHPVGKLAKWVELVVRVEGPIHFDELARRMVEAAGITRVGPRIKDHLKLATRFAEGSGAIRQNGEFLYLNGHAQPPLRDRSVLPASSRKWKYVAPEEIAAVLYKVVKESVAIAPDEAYPLVVKLLGFARVTEEMRNDILVLVPPMVAAGLLEQEGELLRTA